MSRRNGSALVHLAKLRDLREVVELLAVQLREHHIRIARDRIGAAVRELLRKPRLGFVMVARADGRMVAVAYVSHQWTLEYGGLTAWLEELYVRPDCRNRGIGRQLLLAVIAHARELGSAAVDLEVERDHKRAEHLYEREGFRRCRRARWALKLQRSSGSKLARVPATVP